MTVSAGSRGTPWRGYFSIVIFGFMYMPLLVLTVFSFNNSKYGAKWEGFTLEWYSRLMQNGSLLESLRTSLVVAFSAVAVSLVLGTLMAVGLARFSFPGKRFYQGISYLPLIVPEISIAVATLVFLVSIALPLSILTVIISHIVYFLAFIAIVVSSRLSGLDPHLEEAAMDLGANSAQAFVKVLLPQLMPAILSGGLLSFVLSMDDFLLTSFTAGVGATTLPMAIYAAIRTGVTPEINALSVLLIVSSSVIAGLAEFVRRMGKRQPISRVQEHFEN